mmetsp:Transcript_2558/g.6025  ORF Transcript_2558/g.6025 Transcript_2558/m.6025 type:complete len:455 (-) Transcript_2558:960-2324(-)
MPARQTGGVDEGWHPKSHRVYHGFIVEPRTRTLVDEALTIPMLAPRSYTAEDVVEFQTHGGSICTRRVLDCCIACGNVRLARPGEFTLRAFLNGRLDLTQAESIGAVVNARTVEAADAALAGLDGGLKRAVHEMRTECIRLLAQIDAHIDYEDEMEPLDYPGICRSVKGLHAKAQAALLTARKGKYLENGLTLALIGAPNVGKSSLLNILSGADRAIVTEVAGTTRDIVEAASNFGGIPTRLLDTAGIRDQATDVVERLGIERSAAAARSADAVLMVIDSNVGWTEDESAILDSVFPSGDGPFPPVVFVFNQVDTLPSGSPRKSLDQVVASVPDSVREKLTGAKTGEIESVFTSAITGEGLGEMKQKTIDKIGIDAMRGGGESSVWQLNTRQAACLERCKERLDEVIGTVEDRWPIDCCAVHLREALAALNELTGSDVTEDVLDQIFSQFCIGK